MQGSGGRRHVNQHVVFWPERVRNRLDVLARLDNDRLTARAAAGLMAITPRKMYRLKRRYRDGGASAIVNQRRGRSSNNRLLDVVRDHAIALVARTLRRLWTDIRGREAGRAS
jgi:hypothetical protein